MKVDLDIANSRFAQQTLFAYRPMLTPARTIIILGIIAIISFIIGPILLVVNINSQYYGIRYDDECELGSVCEVSFQIDEEIKGDIKLMYKLTNFHQNQKQFLNSRSADQLAGDYVDFSGMLECKPLRSVNDSKLPENWILPCGLSAASVFNDTFKIKSEDPGFSETGIVSKYDVENSFNPLNSKYTTGIKWLENNSLFPGGQTNEHFIEWMKAGATATILKTYSICKDCTLQSGNFTISITNNYPPSFFNGHKYIVLQRESFMGTKNLAPGYTFIGLAIFCSIFIVVIICLKVFMPRKLGDQQMISKMIEINRQNAISA